MADTAGMDAVDRLIVKLAARTFSAQTREREAASGMAMPDGSFPIPDADALRRAIASYGRSNPADRAKVRAHIKRRAAALGLTSKIPQGW